MRLPEKELLEWCFGMFHHKNTLEEKEFWKNHEMSKSKAVTYVTAINSVLTKELLMKILNCIIHAHLPL
jgi:hypothetical protein